MLDDVPPTLFVADVADDAQRALLGEGDQRRDRGREDDQRMRALTATRMDEAARAAVKDLEQVRGLGPATGVPRLDQAGVNVQVAWQRLNGDKIGRAHV